MLKSPQLAEHFEYMLFKMQIDRSQPQYFISTDVDRNLAEIPAGSILMVNFIQLCSAIKQMVGSWAPMQG